MSATKFTPGPWHSFVRMDTKTFAVFGPANDPRFPVVEWTGFDPLVQDMGKETVAANVNLIAAAPELYEALEYARSLIMESLETGKSPKGIFAKNGGKGLSPIDSALAKARGEQS